MSQKEFNYIISTYKKDYFVEENTAEKLKKLLEEGDDSRFMIISHRHGESTIAVSSIQSIDPKIEGSKYGIRY